jgi:hypothetical protein
MEVQPIHTIKYHPEELSRWNQFILGPSFVDSLRGWQKVVLGRSWHLTVHPNLNVCQQVRCEKSITLLGFILDPESPEATNEQILSDLLARVEVFPSLLEATYRFGGRWILILWDGKSTKLIHDACGLRQVFYTGERERKELGVPPNRK